ncbi:MAG: hypothetical protein ACKO04_04020 [Actinomycetes bacterium]
MGEGTMFVERYTVVPAVDVEALRDALRQELVPGPDGHGALTLGLGPSLLGTLAVDALPAGMHPFVDPDRVVRPLRDDVVLLGAGEDPARPARLAPVLTRVGQFVSRPVPVPATDGCVLVVGTADGPDGARHDVAVVPEVERAADALSRLLEGLRRELVVAGATLGADLYVLLRPAVLARVLAPRDR